MSYISTPIQNSIESGTCYASFISDLLCTYNPQSIPTYLEFGGALTAVGLILAVYQLRKPKWDIVLSMRPFWQKWAFAYIGVIGLFLVLMKAIVVSVIGYDTLPVTNPVIFDVLAYVAFIVSPFSLVVFAERSHKLYNENNARRFYETLVLEVSTSDEKRQVSALEVLLDNFETICKALKNADRQSEEYKSAVAVFDVVLSEESIVEYLTTKKLNSLFYIFDLVERYNITSHSVNVGIPSLIRSLLLNNKSFAYKHRNNEGISMSLNIYDQIFKSPKLISGFNLFGYPAIKYSWRGAITSSSVDVIIEALSATIETYYTKSGVDIGHISEGLELIGEIFEETCLNISLEEDRGVDTRREQADSWRILNRIVSFLNHDYLFIAYRKTLRDGVVAHEAGAVDANIHSTFAVNEAYASLLYKCLSGITYIPKSIVNDEHLRLGILRGITFESDQRLGYQQPFTNKLWKRIFYNVKEKSYPAVVWVYLELMGYFLSGEDTGGDGWNMNEARKLRRLLYLDVKPLIDRGERMVNDKTVEEALLPHSIKYENGQFIYHSFNKLSAPVTIAQPAEGEQPMLEGFQPEENDRAYWHH
jgi:hypothetical protein